MAEAETQVFLELTSFALHALRVVGGKVEAGGECVLDNKPALEALLDAVAPNRGTDGIRAGTSVWPSATQWYLSTDTEAMLDRTAESMRTIAAAKQPDPRGAMAYASCNATDGDKVTADGMDKWIMAFAPIDALELVSKTLVDLKVHPDDMKPAGLTGLGAVGSAIRIEGTDGGVVLWDIGTSQSSLVLMTPMGVTEVASCPVGMDSIFEAVQVALKLKFRGAGARLFFNETYDFSEAGPKIAAVIGKAVQDAMANFPKTSVPPVFGSLSLTGKQAWFIREVAASVGLAAWEPSVSKIAGKLGINFKEPEVANLFSPCSLGLLELLSMRIRPRPKWNTEWIETEALPPEDVTVVEDEEVFEEPEPLPPPPGPSRVAPRPPQPGRGVPPPPAPRPQGAPRPKPSLAAEALTAPPPPAPPEPQPASKLALRPGPTGAPRPGGPMPPMPTGIPTPRAPARPAAAPPPEPSQTGYTNPAFPSSGGAPFPSPPSASPFPEPGAAAPAFPPPAAPTQAPFGRGGQPPAFPAPGPTQAPFNRGGQPPAFPTPGATQAPFLKAPPPAPPAAAYSAPAAPALSPFPEAPATGASPSAFPEPGAMIPPPGAPSTVPFPSAGPEAGAITSLPFGKLKPLPLGTTQPAIGATRSPMGSRAPLGSRAPIGSRGPFESEAEPPPKNKVGLYIGIGVAAAVIFAIIAVVVESRLERIKAADLQQQEELARKVTEQRLRDAEEAAKLQADASRKEMEIAILNAKKEAEVETRRSIQQQEDQDRVAHAPGSMLVTTVPEGASVSIDNGPLLTTPVRAEGLTIGTHKVHIFLSGHDPVDLTADIRAGKTTDLGAVSMSSIYGAMTITSTPDNLEYTVRAVNNLMGRPIASGTTPGSVPSLAYGDYLVTFHRSGCQDHNENITVERGVKAAVNTVYQNGGLELSSDPSGANVTKDGSFLGTTPLTLRDLTPKVASFQLDLPGYDPTPVSVQIQEGQTVKFEAKVLRKDRVFLPKEVKTAPVRTEGSNPALNASQRENGGSVLLSFVVHRNGTVGEVSVESTTDDDIARRCKNTVETWRYRPATAPDDRTVDCRIEASFKFIPNQ